MAVEADLSHIILYLDRKAACGFMDCFHAVCPPQNTSGGIQTKHLHTSLQERASLMALQGRSLPCYVPSCYSRSSLPWGAPKLRILVQAGHQKVFCIHLDWCWGRMLVVFDSHWLAFCRAGLEHSVLPFLGSSLQCCFAVRLPSTLTSASAADAADLCLSECRGIAARDFMQM